MALVRRECVLVYVTINDNRLQGRGAPSPVSVSVTLDVSIDIDPGETFHVDILRGPGCNERYQ